MATSCFSCTKSVFPTRPASSLDACACNPVIFQSSLTHQIIDENHDQENFDYDEWHDKADESLKSVRYGPQIKKTSDYKEEEIKTIEHLKVRLSDNAFSRLKLKDKDKITLNGRVVNEKFQGVHLKRATKVKLV